MRTTLDLSEEMVMEVVRITNSKSKTEAIHLALQNLIDRHHVLQLKKFKGKVELDIDIDSLRKRG